MSAGQVKPTSSVPNKGLPTITKPPSPFASTPAPVPAPVAPLSQDQSNAIALMQSTLHGWGLDALLPDLKSLVVAGDTNSDTLSLALSQTAAYKTRFAANTVREADGLPALTPAQYISTEESYRQILQSYGLPSGFYDSPKDFEDFIGKDISPTELDTRAKIAHDQYVAAPAAVKNLWQSYGFAKGDALAAILDPDVATSLIQDRGLQVAIGGAAAQQGLSVTQQRAQALQQSGVTATQATQGYSQIAQALSNDSQIAQRFGTSFNQQDEENADLLGQASAVNKRQTLMDEEQALFKQHGNADAGTLGVSQQY